MRSSCRENKRHKFCELFGNKYYINTFEDWVFSSDFANDILLKHFQTTSLKGFGVNNMEPAVIAAGAAMHYLAETQHDRVSHITKLSRIEEDHYVWLDRFTIRNLELLNSPNENAASFLSTLDHTVSPMGSRLLKRWIIRLKDHLPIEERLDMVTWFTANPDTRDLIRQNIQRIGDLERLISKVSVGKIIPRKMVHLARVLDCIGIMKNACESSGNEGMKKIGEQFNVCQLGQGKNRKGDPGPRPPLVFEKEI